MAYRVNIFRYENDTPRFLVTLFVVTATSEREARSQAQQEIDGCREYLLDIGDLNCQKFEPLRDFIGWIDSIDEMAISELIEKNVVIPF